MLTRYDSMLLVIFSLFFINYVSASNIAEQDLSTFQAGQPAVANEVNANFTAVKTAVNDNDQRLMNQETIVGPFPDHLDPGINGNLIEILGIGHLKPTYDPAVDGSLIEAVMNQSQAIEAVGELPENYQQQLPEIFNNIDDVNIADLVVALVNKVDQLNTELTALKQNSVLALNGFVEFDNQSDYTHGVDTVVFKGVNVQIINEAGASNVSNGTGNLILGYNESGGDPFCDDAAYDNQVDCEANATWIADDIKTAGSHNLVIGDRHSIDAAAGVVIGTDNAINANYATVTGGIQNRALATASSVTSGFKNTANEFVSSISGGSENLADANYASISGGKQNWAYGESASISGGLRNIASANESSVTGGQGNDAVGNQSTVSGGFNNFASGEKSSISGGVENIILDNGITASISGGSKNEVSGEAASISGGSENKATNDYSSVSGGVLNTAAGRFSSATGGGANTVNGDYSSVTGGFNNSTALADWYSSVSGGKDRSPSQNDGLYDWVAGTIEQNE